MSDCIQGTGAIQRGYYRKTRNNVTYPQHRLAYMDKYGPISSDLVIHHLCHNKWCINPDHLKPMTRSEHQVIHANNAARVYYKTVTHCPKGHPLDGRNSKQRYCLECHRQVSRHYRARPEVKRQQHKDYLRRKKEGYYVTVR